MSRLYFTLAIAAVGVASTAQAQCPDGSLPPCRSSGAAAPARRPAAMPTLDSDTWIVVPFDNLAKAEDAEWLRSASVNLLYLDMSRWKDIRVIDDERVADLLRETPEASGANALSLNAGIAVAKRAGAGKLVMGDVLKLGNRTTVTAKVYDVKSGQRMRSVKEDAVVQDSVMPLFGKLARKILNVAPPAGANIGSLGTTRTDAYQEYLAGIAALNRFDLREARTRLGHALTLDSTFALAHYKMSIVMGWDDPNSPLQRRHAESAQRYAAGLPTRERSLITALVHQAANDFTKACEVYSSLAAADSSDVEALYGVGECRYHDFTMEAVGGDTTRLRFRADWNQSIRAFHRVLQLDPQYHLAYQHIIDALTAEQHNVVRHCREGTGVCTLYTGYLIREGDSLSVTPVALTDTAGLRRQVARYAETRSRRRNLEAAHEVATTWVREAPGESRSNHALGIVLLAQGRIAESSDAFSRTRSGTGSLVEELRRVFMRMELAHKLGNGVDAARLYDSARAATTPIPAGPGNPPLRLGNAISGYGPPFGRLQEFDSLMSANMRTTPPLVFTYQRRAIRALLGAPLPDDSLAHFENALFEFTKASRGSVSATRSIRASLGFALRMPRARWPEVDQSLRDPMLRPALALSRGDTAAVRSAAQTLDSIARAIVSFGGSDTGFTVVAAEAYLALNDTTAAQRTVRFALDSAAAVSPYFPAQSSGNTAAYFAPRLMLLRADLAAARGSREEARVWYKRFVDLWKDGNPEVQPVVERARRGYAAAGGSD